MQIPRDAMLLRIFIGESDRLEHQPLYEAIVMKARERHLAGATVLRGPMGFGAASRIHTAKILRLSMDLPIVIEIVDSEEKLNEFLPDLEHMIGGGLVTLEKIKVIITATTNRIESDVERRNHTLGIAGVPSVQSAFSNSANICCFKCRRAAFLITRRCAATCSFSAWRSRRFRSSVACGRCLIFGRCAPIFRSFGFAYGSTKTAGRRALRYSCRFVVRNEESRTECALLPRGDSLSEIDVKVLFHFQLAETHLGSVIAGWQQPLRIVATVLNADVFG